MSWLIESYLEEGKHGPDHPKSLNMHDKYDFAVKKMEEYKDKTDYSGPDKKQIRRFNAIIDADNAEENNTKNKHDREKASNAMGRATDNGQNLHRHNVLSTGDAIMRHNRRHPEAKLESVDMLVEIMQ